jgi:hypothetical protein
MDFFSHAVGESDQDDGVFDLADSRYAQVRPVPSETAREAELASAPAHQDYGYSPSTDPIGKHVSGTELRRRLITPEAGARSAEPRAQAGLRARPVASQAGHGLLRSPSKNRPPRARPRGPA